MVRVERGGQITYHGPGQLVAYTLIDLRRAGIKVREFVRLLEGAVIDTLQSYNVDALRKPGAPGIYVAWQGALAKIAALGLKIRNNSTFHGLALNVDMDLAPYRAINPCGYEGLVTLDMASLGINPGMPRRRATSDRVADLENRTKGLVVNPQDSTPGIGTAPAYDATAKQKSQAKTSRIPIKVVAAERLKKPDWIRVRAASTGSRFYEIKNILREHNLHTVCEEASCPNIGECFGKGTATFMIMGDKCTRRCPFCDVGHGRPDPLDQAEPENLANTIAALQLRYVVITSVDRDDLRDGGAQHFIDCIRTTRERSPLTRIEILTPDFRGRVERALQVLAAAPPDVMNHNLETVPRLYKEARPGSDYHVSLGLLKRFKELVPNVPTKSGLMVGLGETDAEILAVMQDLRAHGVDMLTIGQYLQPSEHHLPVRRYVHPDTFELFEKAAYQMGFIHAAVGPMVRSSYHADEQADAAFANGASIADCK